jgi:hypothetical protein
MDTSVLAAERGLTFWRPQPPIGYASLGDCVTTGTMQPTFQVISYPTFHALQNRGCQCFVHAFCRDAPSLMPP